MAFHKTFVTFEAKYSIFFKFQPSTSWTPKSCSTCFLRVETMAVTSFDEVRGFNRNTPWTLAQNILSKVIRFMAKTRCSKKLVAKLEWVKMWKKTPKAIASRQTYSYSLCVMKFSSSVLVKFIDAWHLTRNDLQLHNFGVKPTLVFRIIFSIKRWKMKLIPLPAPVHKNSRSYRSEWGFKHCVGNSRWRNALMKREMTFFF